MPVITLIVCLGNKLRQLSQLPSVRTKVTSDTTPASLEDTVRRVTGAPAVAPLVWRQRADAAGVAAGGSAAAEEAAPAYDVLPIDTVLAQLQRGDGPEEGFFTDIDLQQRVVSLSADLARGAAIEAASGGSGPAPVGLGGALPLQPDGGDRKKKGRRQARGAKPSTQGLNQQLPIKVTALFPLVARWCMDWEVVERSGPYQSRKRSRATAELEHQDGAGSEAMAGVGCEAAAGAAAEGQQAAPVEAAEGQQAAPGEAAEGQPAAAAGNAEEVFGRVHYYEYAFKQWTKQPGFLRAIGIHWLVQHESTRGVSEKLLREGFAAYLSSQHLCAKRGNGHSPAYVEALHNDLQHQPEIYKRIARQHYRETINGYTSDEEEADLAAAAAAEGHTRPPLPHHVYELKKIAPPPPNWPMRSEAAAAAQAPSTQQTATAAEQPPVQVLQPQSAAEGRPALHAFNLGGTGALLVSPRWLPGMRVAAGGAGGAPAAALVAQPMAAVARPRAPQLTARDLVDIEATATAARQAAGVGQGSDDEAAELEEAEQEEDEEESSEDARPAAAKKRKGGNPKKRGAAGDTRAYTAPRRAAHKENASGAGGRAAGRGRAGGGGSRGGRAGRGKQ